MSERYQIKDQIGRGGVGVVYKAYDTHLGREVAIKRVLVDSGQPIEALTQNLIEEAKVLSSLNHPNIVTVHDVGVDQEGPFVVMEMLHGETLNQIVERGVMPVDDFTEFAVQALEGLIAAQSVNLLHRDLKPPNIMIGWLPSGKFQVKILDFGLAKFSRKPSTQTVDQSDSIFGSIFFMAPEQFEQLPLDGRTDLYSLGSIFYYTLAGEYPFQGEMAAQVMAAHLRHKMIPLQEHRPDLPASLCDWIETLMARNMEDRPLNAKAALESLNPVEAIDEKQLREVTSNDPDVAVELFDQFVSETRGLLEMLLEQCQNEQGAEAGETAQTIRGNASTLGYREIIDLAKEIEEYSQSDPVHCIQVAESFPGAITRLGEAISRMKW